MDIDGAVDMASTLQVDGSITSSDSMIITTADNNIQLTLKSTDADANVGPVLDLTRDSSSPAAQDVLGQIRFMGEDAGSSSLSYAHMTSYIVDPTDGSEDGKLEIDVREAGTQRSRLLLDNTGAVFNNESRDLDFRVESDGDTHALFVEGSSGTVGMAGRLHTGTGLSDARITLSNTGTENANSSSYIRAVSSAIIYNSASSSHIWEIAGSEKMRLIATGHLYLGSTSQLGAAKFLVSFNGETENAYVAKTTYSGLGSNFALFMNSSNQVTGYIRHSGSTTVSYTTSSDYRLKEDDQPMTGATERVKALRPVNFAWKADGVRVDGFLAHEAQALKTQCVTKSTKSLRQY